MRFLTLLLTICILVVSCTESNPVSYAMEMDPGTLGVSSSAALNCPETDVARVFDNLTDSSEFTIPLKDSSAVQWWIEGGYDFLNYRCLKIKKAYYMISLNSEDFNATTISIRSIYDQKRKSWIHAKEFNDSQEYLADKAMKYLLYKMPVCE